jgi:3-phenylpropionate/trans-cinnamate dioxygenase ferredoxin subunit
MTFTPLIARDELVEGRAQQVRLDGRVLAVVLLGSDVYVLSDRCSHEEFSLSLGEVDVDDKTIECERHGALFSLETGAPVTFPATQPVEAYATRQVNGFVEVDLP